jgi:two-component system phosphate regulon sensor histidine kinase PhoR
MHLTLRQKIILLVLSLLFIVTIAASIISTMELQKYYKDRIFTQMTIQLDEIDFLLASKKYDLSNEKEYNFFVDYAKRSRHRLTLMNSAGIVLFDSDVPLDSLHSLQNHMNRPEIQMINEKNIGQNQRISATLNQSMYYAAKEFSGDTDHPVHYIRLALPSVEIQNVLNTVRWKIMLGGGMALILIAIVSFIIASRLTHPIQQLATIAERIKRGDYDARFNVQGHDEIHELAELLNDMLDRIRHDLVRMEKLELVRSQFLGNVSHELRTPIFSVQGYLETLMNNPKADPEKLQKFIKKAYRQAARLNSLLTDLIDISRIESGEMKMTFSPFDVHEWLEKMVADLQESATENKVRVSLVNDKNQHIKVLGDRDRLNQVIYNLATNAIKYNVENGRVDFGYIVRDRKVEIYVSDTGRGIEQQHLSRIFERFYRVDKERSREVGGTGLGLAIVKHITEAHNSKIFVESEMGVGSRFSFRLRQI